MPVSRLLTHESRNPSQPAQPRTGASVLGAGKASLAFGALALATAITLLGAPAAEALGLF